MKIKNAIAAAIGTIMSFTLLSVGASAGTLPFGVQIGVDKTTVQNDWGWSECFSTSGSSFGSSLAGIQSSCTGNYLMLATYVNGSDDYAILAGAAHADVLFDTGVQSGNSTNIDTTHTANGAEWYFSTSWSWGFTDLGNVVRLNSCDIGLHPNWDNNTGGMCWHTGSGNLNAGWGYNDGSFKSISSGHTRVVLSLDALTEVSEPGTFAVFGLGLAVVGFARRRRFA